MTVRVEASEAERDKFKAEIAAMPAQQRDALFKAETNRIQANANRISADANKLKAEASARGGIPPAQAVVGYEKVLDALGEQIRDIEYNRDLLPQNDPRRKKLEATAKDLSNKRKRITSEMEELLNRSKEANSVVPATSNAKGVPAGKEVRDKETNEIFRMNPDGSMTKVGRMDDKGKKHYDK
jgi:uncharacterized protein (DUF3084 family)